MANMDGQHPYPKRYQAVFVQVLCLFTLAIFSLPFYFSNDSLDGDALQHFLLYRDLFFDGFRYANWSPAPGCGFEVSMLFDFVCFWLARNNVVVANYLLCLFKVFLLYGSLLMFLRMFVQPQFVAVFSVILVSCLAVTLYLLSTTSVIFCSVHNLHLFWYMSLGLWFLYFVFQIVLSVERMSYYLFACFVLAVGITGTTRFTSFFVAPVLFTLLLVCVITVFVQCNFKWKLYKITASSWVVSSVFYLYIYPLTYPNYFKLHQYLPKFSMQLDQKFLNFVAMIQPTLLSISWSFLMIVGCFLILLYLCLFACKQMALLYHTKEITTATWKPLFLSLVTMVSVFAIFLMNMMFSKGNVARYYLYIPFFLLLFFVCWLGISGIVNEWLQKYSTVLYLGVFLLFLCILSFASLPTIKQAKVSFSAMMQFHPHSGELQSLSSCLDHHKHRYQLKYGIAEYWTARPIQVMSHQKIRVYQIEPSDLTFYHWANNVEYYWQGSKVLGKPTYNFVIVGYQEIHNEFTRWLVSLSDQKLKKVLFDQMQRYEQQGYSRAYAISQIAKNSRDVEENKVIGLFGKPTHTFSCTLFSGVIRKVLVYDESTQFNEHLQMRFRLKYRYLRSRQKYPFVVEP